MDFITLTRAQPAALRGSCSVQCGVYARPTVKQHNLRGFEVLQHNEARAALPTVIYFIMKGSKK